MNRGALWGKNDIPQSRSSNPTGELCSRLILVSDRRKRKRFLDWSGQLLAYFHSFFSRDQAMHIIEAMRGQEEECGGKAWPLCIAGSG